MPALPVPDLAECGHPYNILLTGIGGTGVVTVGALLGMAAHLEGKGGDCTGHDRPGSEVRRRGQLHTYRRNTGRDKRHAHTSRQSGHFASLRSGCGNRLRGDGKVESGSDGCGCKSSQVHDIGVFAEHGFKAFL
ncbi:MAG: hypothetical protein GY792_04930 [Gammaproteobacteria bacterium]|nr:hypothetical protein [Gammaproteobacteria bacterium]